MHKLKKDFPLFDILINKRSLVYLDNAATTHKPLVVIDAISDFYKYRYATANRSMYHLSELVTQDIENVREHCARFINASSQEIIFTKGATESINFIAATWAYENLQKGDEIVLTQLEHHSNILPWLHLAAQKGIIIKYIPVLDTGLLDYAALSNIITKKTKLISVVHISNALGTVVDIQRVIDAAHQVGALCLVDACQSVGYIPVDVTTLNADFLVFSAHKMLGPTGLGILYIKKDVQEQVPPYQYGGGMVYDADYQAATWLTGPHRYEAGTPPIAEIIGFGATLDYYRDSIDFLQLKKHTTALINYTIDQLSALPAITLLGPIEQLRAYGHLVSFIVRDMHAHDVGALLDTYGIAVRTGHYCAQPLAKRLNIKSSVRISVHLYNTFEDIDYMIAILKKYT